MAPEYSSKAAQEAGRRNLLSGTPDSSDLITPKKEQYPIQVFTVIKHFPSTQQKYICFTSNEPRVQLSSQHDAQIGAFSDQDSGKAGVTSAVRWSTYKDNLKEEYKWALGTQSGTADWRANSWTNSEAGGEKLCWLDRAVCRFMLLPVEFHCYYTLHGHKTRSQRHLIFHPNWTDMQVSQSTCDLPHTRHSRHRVSGSLMEPKHPVRRCLRVQKHVHLKLSGRTGIREKTRLYKWVQASRN